MASLSGSCLGLSSYESVVKLRLPLGAAAAARGSGRWCSPPRALGVQGSAFGAAPGGDAPCLTPAESPRPSPRGGAIPPIEAVVPDLFQQPRSGRCREARRRLPPGQPSLQRARWRPSGSAARAVVRGRPQAARARGLGARARRPHPPARHQRPGNRLREGRVPDPAAVFHRLSRAEPHAGRDGRS